MRLARCVSTAIVWMAIAAAGSAQTIGGDVSAAPVDAPRPGVLLPLYGSLAVVQALDFDSTLKALSVGHHEANPLLQVASQSPAVLLAVKAGAAASMIVVSERLRKRHPKMAIALMAGINSAYAMVAIHNYSALQRRSSASRAASANAP